MFDTFVTQETVDTNILDQVFKISKEAAPIEEPATNIFNNTTPEKILDQASQQAAEIKTPPIANIAEVSTILADAEKELEPPVVVTDETQPPADPVDTTAQGRPKTDKNALAEYLSTKVEAGDFGIPADYDAGKQTVPEYFSKLPVDKLYSILDTNYQVKEQEIRATAPQEFYAALPDPVKIVAEYAAKGGTDWNGLLSSMIQTNNIVQLDINNEEHHIPIVKTYLQATTQMTPGQIDEQIEDWKDNGKLDKKAIEFKAPLDALQKQHNDQYIRQAEEQRAQQDQLANFYAENVYKVADTGELAGYKLDKKFAKEIAYNMTTTAPGPWTGQPVNYLGYGLEKCQYVAPDYEAVMLAAWLLNDKPAALAAMAQMGANKSTEETLKLIKLNQGIPGQSQVIATENKPVVKRLPDNSRVLRRS